MLDKVKELIGDVQAFKANTKDEVETFRIKFLGSKGLLKDLFAEFKNVAPASRKDFGQALNTLKRSAEDKVAELTDALESNLSDKSFYGDLTRPSEPINLGSRHPISLVRNQIIEVFNRIGFTVSEGPEIEDDSLIRIDMSEYMEKFAISRLIGAPPGYVGYEEGGQLTEKVRRKPYAVILLDEIEKAHPDVFNILLQILDDGFITDSLGRKIDFRNTIIIMTSNIGARQLKDFGGGVGFGTATKAAQADEHAKSVIEGALKKSFAPEFLNRIDDVIIFNALEREDIHAIIDIELDKLLSRISDLGYTLDLSEKAKDYIADKGFDKKYGARPLKRAIQKYIEDALAEEIVNSKLSEGDTIKMDLDEKGNKLTIQIEKTKKKIKTKTAS